MKSCKTVGMTARYYERTSGLAVWSRRIALFAVQLIILAVILHRFGFISSQPAIYVLGSAILLAFIALAISASSLVGIWKRGLKGGGYAVAAVLLAALVLAGPLYFVPKLIALPRINDVSTDTTTPPTFDLLAGQRGGTYNPAAYPGGRFAAEQSRAYPQLRPMVLERSSTATFDLVKEAVDRLGWEIVAERAPKEGLAGKIEAVARSPVMGFKDDVTVRVISTSGESKIDVRSASRYGDHDFGSNAQRISSLFNEVKAGMEQGERTALELALARRAEETREIERRQREKERAERERMRKEEEARQRAMLEEDRARQEAQLKALREEELRSESQSPAGYPLGSNPYDTRAQGAPTQRAQRRGGRLIQDVGKFFRRFGE